MSTDIAELGLKVDDRDAIKAVSTLAKLEKQGGKTERAVKGLKQETEKLNRQNKKTNASTKALTNGVSQFTKALVPFAVGYMGVQAIKRTVMMADNFTLLEARVKTATEATGDFDTVMADLIDVSLATGSSLQENINLFDRVRVGAKELGRTNQEILAMTDVVNKLGVIGGSSIQEMQFSMRQFSQAMAGGIVRAEEFNSIIENTPKVAEAIAIGLGKSIGELRGMVLEGELLADDVFEALLGQGEKINAQFEKMPLTIGRATTNFTTSFTKAVGALNKEFAITQGIAEVIDQLARGLDVVTEKATGPATIEEKLAALGNERLKLVMDTIPALEEQARKLGFVGEIAAKIEHAKKRILAIDKDVSGLVAQREENNKLIEQEAKRNAEIKERNRLEAEAAKKAAEREARVKAAKGIGIVRVQDDPLLNSLKADDRGKEQLDADYKEFERVQNRLRTEEEEINASYKRRTEIILRNTEEGSALQTELMKRATAERDAELLEASDDYWSKYLNAMQEQLVDFNDLAATSIQTFTDGMSQAFQNLILESGSASDAVDEFAKGMARSTIAALSDMAAQWLAYQAVQLLVGKTTQAAGGTAMIAEAQAGSALAGIHAFSSTAAIPLVGPALAPGAAAAAIAATQAMAAGVTAAVTAGFAGSFDKGGYIPGGKFGIVGEIGPELVSGPMKITGRKKTEDLLGGGSGDDNSVQVTNVIQMSTGVSATVRAEVMQMMPQIAEMTKRNVLSAMNEGGTMSRMVGKRR